MLSPESNSFRHEDAGGGSKARPCNLFVPASAPSRAWSVVARILLLYVLYLCGSVRCVRAEVSVGPTVHFRLLRDFAIVVPVYINGSGPFDFLLDTGSTCSAADRELGEELHLAVQHGETVRTLVGQRPTEFALAQRVTIGPTTAEHVQLQVRKLGGLRILDPAIRGVLGQDTLSHADYMIDYARRTIEFDRYGELLNHLSGAKIKTGRLAEGALAYGPLTLQAEVVEDVPRTRELVLDTGTASIVLFDKNENRASETLGSSVRDDEGKWKRTEVRHVRLQLGSREWDVFAQGLQYHEEAREIGGLIPTSLFERIYISNSGSFVMLSPKVKRERAMTRATARLGAGLQSGGDSTAGESSGR